MRSFFAVLFVLFSLVLISANAFAVAPSLDSFTVEKTTQNDFVNDVVDLWGFASDAENNDEQLNFQVISQSNPDEIVCYVDNDRFIDCVLVGDASGGVNVVEVKVTDTEGLADSGTFVIILNDFDSGPSLCRDIDIRGRTLRLDEDSEETFSFVINNLSNRGFEITDFRVRESNNYVDIFDEQIDNDFIDEDEDTVLEFTVEVDDVSRNQEVSATVEIEGEFDNGVRCDFDDLDQPFRIIIDDAGSGNDDFDFDNSVCSDIEIDTDRIYLSEDDTKTVEVTVRNENNRDFDVSFVSLTESSPDFTVSVSNRPSRIDSEDEEVIRLRFESDRVSRDETDDITLKISGRFSNGQNCSSSTISEKIDVVVENGSTGSSNDSDDIELSINPALLQLNAGETKFVTATIENNTSSRKSVELDLILSGSNFSGEIETDAFSLSARDDRTVDVRIKADSGVAPGNYSARVEVKFGSNTSSKTFNIKVLGSGTKVVSGDLEVINFPLALNLLENDAQNFNVTVSNSSNSVLTNLAVTMENLPQGVFFQPYFKQKIEKGEIITVSPRIETNNVSLKQFDAVLKISVDGKTINRTVRVSVEDTLDSQNEQGSSAAGLASLATTISIGIVLLAILAVVVIVVVLIVRK